MSVAETEIAPAGQTGAGLPTLRLLPAPLSEPPYDDELPAGRLHLVAPSGGGVGAAAVRPLPTPATPAPPALRLLPTPSPSTEDDEGPARTPLSDLPPAAPFAHALVQRLLEVLAGLRPLGQLQPDTTLEVFDELIRTVSDRPRSTGPRPTRRDVRSVHVQARADGVAEVCATVRRGARMTALAFRLEGRSGAWRCTELIGV